MNWFEMSYTVLGGLGIFLYGMIQLSQSLQIVSGHLIRKAINSLTSNRIIAVMVGTVVTILLQSSSITTVMIVGFVNAGLMSLTQAIGVILGANIGTTITGWIISIKVGKYALLLVGAGSLVMLISKREKISSWARVIFALGLIFLGLETMSGAFKPLRSYQGFLDVLTYFSADSLMSVYGTIAVGCLLTMVVQSSSAMLGITIALATTGAISFQTAVALVLGENIGTTITALLAGINANLNARRAACAHAIFNVLGVVVISSFFWPYVELIENLLPNAADFVAVGGEKPFIAEHIALSHTLFNVTNVIVFLPFLNWLSKLVSFILKDGGPSQPKHLEFLGTKSTLSAELALQQGRMELVKVGGMVKSMLDWTKQYTLSPEEERSLREKVMKYESITDNIHQEMTTFMGHVLQIGLGNAEVAEAKMQLRLIDELESIGDYCQKIVRHVSNLAEQREVLDADTQKQLGVLLDAVIDYYDAVREPLRKEQSPDAKDLANRRAHFEKLAEYLRDDFLARVVTREASPLASMTVADIVLSLRRIISHTRAIAGAVGQVAPPRD